MNHTCRVNMTTQSHESADRAQEGKQGGEHTFEGNNTQP